MAERFQFDNIPPRDPQHELAPYVEPSKKTDGQIIADRSISIIDEATNLVLGEFQKLKDEISVAEQMVLNAQCEVRDTIRAQMRIVETAMAVQLHIKKQLAEAVKPLIEANSKGANHVQD